MPSSANDALALIRDLSALLKEETFLLASPEDAQYFRQRFKKRAPEPKVSEPPLPEPVRPPLPPPPEPKVSEPPLPKPVPAPLPRAEPRVAPSSLKSLIAKIAPEMAILDEIPSDTAAKKIADRWKTKNQTAPITLLHYTEPGAQKTLLEKIAKALDVYFGPARLIAAEPIEKEKQWGAFLSADGLKLVIACDYTLWQLQDLMRHYKEVPAQSIRTLGNVPLFLLPDLSLYLKDPLLKRSLWKALCQKLSS